MLAPAFRIRPLAPACIAATLLVSTFACAGAPARPAPRAPGLKESTASAEGMLRSEYPSWATELGPVPGRVVGLLLPAQSRWGRSLQWIGEGIVSHPDAYGFPSEQHRVYQLYARGVSPRVVSFLAPGGVDASPLSVGRSNPFGLGREAHLVELEINGGTGAAGASTFTLTATGARAVEGQPGYPRDLAQLLDGARATFDQFVQARAAEVAKVLEDSATRLQPMPGITPRESAAEGIFPYWDEERRRLTVTFTRRVMRVSEYGVPCLFVYEGMPAQQKSMQISQAYGVELGQTLVLDAQGALVEARHFEPAPIILPSNDPEPPPPGEQKLRHFRTCPGSPGARRHDFPLPRGGPDMGPFEAPAPATGVCGNGTREQAPEGMEACDGKDLGGRTCEALGFLGGTLGCSARCTLDGSRCEPGGSPASTVRDVLEGTQGTVLVAHGKIALVAVRGRALVARFFSGPDVTAADGSPESRWDLPPAQGSSLGYPVVGRVDSGFLVAVPVYGASVETLILLLSPDGRWAGPLSRVPGRPVFLARGDRHALLGLVTERRAVLIEVVRVDDAGKLAGAPVAAIEAAPTSTYALASAAFTGDGWLVAAGNNGNPFVNVLKYARVGLDGRPAAARMAPVGTGQLRLVRGRKTTFAVHTGPGGVAAVEIPDAGTEGSAEARPPKVISSDFFPGLVAAQWEVDRLFAWAVDRSGRLRRLSLDLRTGAREDRTALAAPAYAPMGADFAEGVLVHLFQVGLERDRPMERALWLYRGS